MRDSFAGCLQKQVLAAVLAICAASTTKPSQCGIGSCPQGFPELINVHIVPHSHNDVGWLKTVDEYYYGTNTQTQRGGVQNIIDSVVTELLKNPYRRFIQVETAFFAKWWNDQNESLREKVKTLVKKGQLQFVGGAWTMNDEATTNYQSIIDQFTLGYRFLNDTFGICSHPRVAWQIGPFGHSRGFATLLTQMNLDGVFFARIDFQDRENRTNQRTQEMVWKTSPNLGNKADLFTSVLYRHYDPPPGFCFDELCSDEPIIDDPHYDNYISWRAEEFIGYVYGQAQGYTNNVLVTMGGDFHYQSAGKWYNNLDKLIKQVNANEEAGVFAFYSTPSCYLQALHETNMAWTTKEDDFFPYGSSMHSYWTGYFTSRPTYKFLERQSNNFLQVSKQLYSLAKLTPQDQVDLSPLKEAMGVFQHHDAITGTERDNVARDYATILAKGFTDVPGQPNVHDQALKKLTKKPVEIHLNTPVGDITFTSCMALNTSQCETSEQNYWFVVTVYNPQAQKENTYVRVPVPKGQYSVLDPQGREQKHDLVPIPKSVLHIPGRILSSSYFELVFYAEQLPPLGFRSYIIYRNSDIPAKPSTPATTSTSTTIGFEGSVRAEVSYQEGLLMMNITTADNVTINVNQNFYYYTSAVGDKNEDDPRASGAYVFRPNGTARIDAKNWSFKIFRGELVHEVQVIQSDWVSLVVRIYAKENYIENVWQVGPIPIDDDQGKEVISRFDTTLETNDIFYTDANGREMIQRKRDFRPTWNVNLQEKISGNYYPVTSRITLRDPKKNQTVSVFVDRAQGGSSLQSGQVELMVHRRILQDDGLGVGEPLNETAFGTGVVARGTHVLLVGQDAPGKPTLAAQERILSRRLLLKPWLFFSDGVGWVESFSDWQARYVMEFSGLAQPLPDNVHLLTLEPWRENTLLVRLEHIMEKNDDPTLSKPATLNLQVILRPFTVVGARETTLAANEWIGEYNRLIWNTQSSEDPPVVPRKEQKGVSFDITLNPQEIRTFVVTIEN